MGLSMPQQCFLLFQPPWKASTCAPASWVIDRFSFPAEKFTSGNLSWGDRGRSWIVESSELLHYLRFSQPEWNPPLPTAVPPNVHGCGNSWKKKKRGWWNRNAATPPEREWLRQLVENYPCTFPGMHPKIRPPWLPKDSPAHLASHSALMLACRGFGLEVGRQRGFFSEICFRL